MLIMGCSSNTESESKDSLNTKDSPNVVEQTVQTQPDSLPRDTKVAQQDSVNKATAQYDDLINEYVSTVNSFYKASQNLGKGNNWEKGVSLLQKCWKIEDKIKKVKGKLSPEQLKKYKSAKSKFNKANAPGRYAG